MRGVHHSERIAVFKPRFIRFVFVELWSAAIGILILGLILGVLQVFSLAWLIAAVAAALIGVGLGGTVLKGPRRIVIGDEWVEGAGHLLFDSTTIRFDTMDRARSGFKGGRLLIMSLSGRCIEARTAWYSPEDVEEMKRLLRDRIADAQGKWEVSHRA